MNFTNEQIERYSRHILLQDIGVEGQEKINQINPDVNVVTYHQFFTAENAFEIIRDYDFIVDGTDNFSAKFLINDACILAGKSFSYGGILRFDGQTLTHQSGTTCYRCIFPAPPPPDAQKQRSNARRTRCRCQRIRHPFLRLRNGNAPAWLRKRRFHSRSKRCARRSLIS